MGFFTTRERAALGKSAEAVRPQRKVRELTPQDFAPRRRPAENDLAGHVQSLMQRVTDNPLQQIDDLIGDLRRRRQQLLSESARVQREIIEYAKLNQTAMQSNKIITESLAHLNRALGPSGTEAQVAEDVSAEQDAEQEQPSEPLAQHQEHAEGGDEPGGRDSI